MNNTSDFNLKKVLPAVLTIAIGMLLVMMDTTIMNVTLPHIQTAFHQNLSNSQWVITTYTLAMATAIPFAGFLGDRFSDKRIFALAIIFFTIASLLAANAHSLQSLIIWRIAQGLTGGVVAPIGIGMSFKVIPMEKRGSMMGILGLPMLLAPTIGPALSGFLVKYFNWSTVFLINLPVGILALIFILLFLPNFPANKASKIDLKGALLSPFAFPILIYGVHIGADKGWSNPSAIAFMSVGLLMLLLFILVELRVENPLLHLRAFTIPEFTKGISLMWLNQIVVFGAMLLVPLYLQNIVGLSSVNTGLMMVPQAIASFLGMTIGGRVFDKFGTKAAVLPGFTLGGISLILFAQTSPHSSLTFTLCAIVLLGLSQGLVNMQVNNHALQAVPMKSISRVTPLTNEMMQVVNSFAIAFLTAFLSSQIKNQSSLSPLQANLTAFHHTFWLLLIFVSVGFISSLFLRKKVKV